MAAEDTAPLPPPPPHGFEAAEHVKSFKDRIIPKQTDDVTVYWSRATILAIFIAGVLAIICESWIMINENWLINNVKAASPDGYNDLEENFLVGQTYHGIFLAAFLFWMIVTWDGVMHKNLMQVLSVNIYNFGLLVYSFLQIIQTKTDLEFVRPQLENPDDPIASNTGLFLFAQVMLPAIIGFVIPSFAYLTYRLHGEFGWRQYRITGGSKQLENVFFTYHILLLLLKFSVFFVIGFTIFDLVLTAVSDKGKVIIGISAAVVGILVPACGYYGARNERKHLIFLYMFGCLCVLAYIVQRVWQAYYKEYETPESSYFDRSKLPFMLYACLSFLLVLVAFVYGFICLGNFNRGLKEVLDQEEKRRKGELEAPVVDLDA
ncbi:hypothetical protein CcCBS67573_g02403 [Chytriomyces confervae]|uniref:Uncharacterized protein n=1 Tax=Chytriomyces confervae TaxID=246404 RepID=A0A507FMT2_9FUNG|nr:hypothetical protein CcCBS67573_g02403 [Chytriomyces confervae]